MSSIGKVNAALAAAILFLLLSSCSAYLAFTSMDSSQTWVRHTRDVQNALAQFSMATARAGRLRSEYLDTGDDALLQQQAEVVREIRNAAAAVQRLTADNTQQQANSNRLAELKERRITLLAQAIDLKKTGKSTPAAQAEISRQSLAAADETDQVLQHMYDAEEQLLVERQGRASRFTTLTAEILLTSLFLALVLFLLHHRLLMVQVSARSRAELAQRALSAKLLTLQDEERRKFARELHDSVGQHLAAIKMALFTLLNKLPGDRVLQDCINLLDDSISETRTISHLLHPPLLDEAGLNSASRWFVEGFGKRSGIDVTLDICDGTGRFPEATELVLFRVLQESLTNVHRHSGAKRADVSLQTAGNQVILRVRDYGSGMPPAVVQSLREDGSGGGVGLAGMTERIREIGGTLEINSSAIGTEIVARVPVPKSTTKPLSPPRMQEVKE
ncbi:MAG TPA: CHASE3 domain-containing protein [Candidatus Sulfotelmatobacter sp.]|nr:CHASE3 domain-containing protein [Candidatus Sulfotelmatobacter sp.]